MCVQPISSLSLTLRFRLTKCLLPTLFLMKSLKKMKDTVTPKKKTKFMMIIPSLLVFHFSQRERLNKLENFIDYFSLIFGSWMFTLNIQHHFTKSPRFVSFFLSWAATLSSNGVSPALKCNVRCHRHTALENLEIFLEIWKYLDFKFRNYEIGSFENWEL